MCVCVCVTFHLVFFLCHPPALPVHPAVIGYLALAGVKIQGLSHETAMVQVGLRVPTPLVVEKKRPVLLQVLRLTPGALLLHGS